MVEADDPRDLPRSIFLLPEMDELGLADRFGSLVSRMVEAVYTDLHRAVFGNGIHLQRPRHKFSGHFAADVVLDALHQSLPSAAQASFIVINLKIVGKQHSEFFQIEWVVAVEKLGFH